MTKQSYREAAALLERAERQFIQPLIEDCKQRGLASYTQGVIAGVVAAIQRSHPDISPHWVTCWVPKQFKLDGLNPVAAWAVYSEDGEGGEVWHTNVHKAAACLRRKAKANPDAGYRLRTWDEVFPAR